MTSVFTLVDDKHVLLHRILWVAQTPHFCGEDDCTREGQYEIRLEFDESVWANREERDQTVVALESYYGDQADWK